MSEPHNTRNLITIPCDAVARLDDDERGAVEVQAVSAVSEGRLGRIFRLTLDSVARIVCGRAETTAETVVCSMSKRTPPRKFMRLFLCPESDSGAPPYGGSGLIQHQLAGNMPAWKSGLTPGIPCFSSRRQGWPESHLLLAPANARVRTFSNV